MPQGETALKKIKERFNDSILAVVTFRNETQALVKKKDVYPIMQFLRDEQELFFNCLVNLTAVDRVELSDTHRFEVVYHLHSYKTNDRICIKTPVDENDLTVKSMTSLWKTANWQEREVYDLYGITFEDHPDMRRILLWEGYDGYPLRKDYPLRGRGEREKFDEYLDNIKR